MSLALISPGHRLRPEAEACARDVFRETYGAKVRELPLLLAAWQSFSGRITAVTGLRTSASGFFSEYYLPGPVETVLGRLAEASVERGRILEFSTLASTDPNAAIALIGALRINALHWGFDWAFFTATAPLRTLLRRQGIVLTELAAADPLRAPRAADWGSYYRTNPIVCAVPRAQTEARRRPGRQAHPVSPMFA